MPSMVLRRSTALGVFAIAVVSFALAACSSDRGTTPSSSSGSIPASNAATAPLLPTRADALPDFTLARYDDLLRQLRGTPVIVNLWGSWCPPCKTEAPMLAEAHRTYGDRVQFIGVDIEDSVSAGRQFVRRYGWTFPSIRDPDFPSAFRQGLGFVGQPDTLFYDAAGHLASSWQGPITKDALRSGVRSILRTASPSA